MTEVPEHLLERSRAARSRLTGEGGDEAAAPAEAQAAEGAETAPAKVEAAAAPVVESEPLPPPPVPPYVEAAEKRPKIPVWVTPLLLILPLWAFFYAGTLSPPPDEGGIAVEGNAVFNGQGCSGCHGATGSGGTGPQLNDGEVLATFSDPLGQIWWVTNGSPTPPGTPYGDPDRAGGQSVSYGFSGNPMASFGDNLTADEIVAVVYHERVALSGQPAEELDWMIEWIESEEFPESFEGLPVDEAEAVAQLQDLAGEFLAEAEDEAEDEAPPA